MKMRLAKKIKGILMGNLLTPNKKAVIGAIRASKPA
jgi:hypothetical protein